MSNENLFAFAEIKRNESTREEKNSYFDTSSITVPKSDEPRYCNKNVATPKAINLNYKPRFCTNLTGVRAKCATYNVSLFH